MPEHLKDNFRADLKKLLIPIGFEFKVPGSRNESLTCSRNAEGLYCHPMDLSGYVRKDSLPEIENVLKMATAFKLRAVDTYEEVLNYTTEEFFQKLLSKKEELDTLLLDAFRTEKKNQFRGFSAMSNIKLGMGYFRNNSVLKEMEEKFINQALVDLVRRAKIVTANTEIGIAYKTASKLSKKAS
jgi:hypothetical protein